jgi:hypothetical protein
LGVKSNDPAGKKKVAKNEEIPVKWISPAGYQEVLMSFALGFYEIFSYAIPGFLYILVVNGFLQLFKLPHMNLGQIPGTLGFVALMAVLSYLAGHLVDPIAYRWYLLFNRKSADEAAIGGLKGKYPQIKIEFSAGDRRLLYSFIKHKNLSLAEYLDKFNAIGILLQNLSLGLCLFALTQIAYIVLTGHFLQYGLGAILGLVFSFIAIKRGALFKGWYTQGIFEQALHYGNNIERMFEEEWPEEKAPKPAPTRKPRARAKTSTKSSNTTATKTRTTKIK